MATKDDIIPKASGLKRGDSSADVRRLQGYLARYGYLDSPVLDEFGLSHEFAEPPPEKEGRFDDNTEAALVRLQEFFGLDATGTLTTETLELLQQPRCGVPDAPVTAVAGLAESTVKWTTNNLRWGLGTLTTDLTGAQVRSAVQTGFGLWSAVTPLTFTEATFASNPEIRIWWGATNHPPCPSAFGATTLAHAYYPPPNNGDLAGDAHFNTAYTWSVSNPATGIDLATVAGHEFGHSLGLAHSNVAGALMFPSYGGLQRFLHQDDITRIQALYGQQQLVTATIARVYTTPQSRNAWAMPTGMGWHKVRPTSTNGVTNTYATLVSARKAAATATIQITDGEITAAYR
jgi:peptidoglycan hydrolase-like protein with peptidoglycan-binding domain